MYSVSCVGFEWVVRSSAYLGPHQKRGRRVRGARYWSVADDADTVQGEDSQCMEGLVDESELGCFDLAAWFEWFFRRLYA